MTRPRKEQLDILRAVWTVTTVTVTGSVTSTVLPGSFVSSSITQIPGGSIVSSPPTRGIVTTDIGGFVRIRQSTNALSLDFNGLQIFGRLAFSAGNYVLSYKVVSGGVETAATIPAGTYTIQLMYSEVMNFGEIPVTADVIYGYNQELLPSGSAIAGNLTVGGNTILGTNSSNTLSVNAELNTSLIPTPDNTVSLGSSSLRFATTNTTSLAARADNTDTIKSVLTASSLLASNTVFTLDGNNSLAIGPTTATAVNISRTGVTTTINGTLVAAGLATVGGNLTVNGGSSIFNGNLNVTGVLNVGSILFSDLDVVNNTVLGSNSSNTINFLASMISSIIPQTADVYDIGAVATRWRNIHSTRLFTHYDSSNSNYSFLEPNNLFSSVDFDVDGYGTLFLGVSYANNISLGHSSAPVAIDGYNIVLASNNYVKTNTPRVDFSSSQQFGKPQNVSGGEPIIINFDHGGNAIVTVSDGYTTIGQPVAAQPGGNYHLEIVRTFGSESVSWNPVWIFGSKSPAPELGAGVSTSYEFWSPDGYYLMCLGKASSGEGTSGFDAVFPTVSANDNSTLTLASVNIPMGSTVYGEIVIIANLGGNYPNVAGPSFYNRMFAAGNSVTGVQFSSGNNSFSNTVLPFLDGEAAFTTPAAGTQFFTISNNTLHIQARGFNSPRAWQSNHPYLNTVNVTNATSLGGLIKITTVSPHGLFTGDQIFLGGITAGTTEANGMWVITVVDATNFTLQGSTFVNTYTAGGTVFASIFVTNVGNIYVLEESGTSAASGGPTGTPITQVDGTARWIYIGPTSSGLPVSWTCRIKTLTG